MVAELEEWALGQEMRLRQDMPLMRIINVPPSVLVAAPGQKLSLCPFYTGGAPVT